MAILDWDRFNALPPRSGLTVLCQCDRCGKQANVPKHKFYHFYKNGKVGFYKSGQEPSGFVPKYEETHGSLIAPPIHCGVEKRLGSFNCREY